MLLCWLLLLPQRYGYWDLSQYGYSFDATFSPCLRPASQLFQIQDTNMTNCHCSNSCCHLPRRLWWLVHLHCSYVDATFFTPFCFSSPASQLFLIQDSNCQKNSYFCCHLPLEKALLATPIHTPTTLQLQSHQRSKLLLCLGCQLFLLLAATSTF